MRLTRRWVSLAMSAMLAATLVPVGASAAPAPAATNKEALAQSFLAANAAAYSVTAADVADLKHSNTYRDAHNGVTHVNLLQRYQGLEVFTGTATVNMTDDGSIVFVGESLVGNLNVGASGSAELDATEAVAAAAGALALDEPVGLEVLSREPGLGRETVVSDGGISNGPIPAQLGWQPTAKGLRLAWRLTIDSADAENLWNATVDAETGALLDSEDWTIHDRMEDLESTLGPRGGRRAASQIMSTATQFPVSPNPVNDGSSYRVFRVPNESPNDAARTLLNNPADGLASPFGWHDTDGVAGAEFTITRGNATHAYLDQDDNETPDFGADPQGGAGLDFDNPVNFSEHSQAYRDAVTVNLFYGCNFIHDVLYRYGFHEISGNFQANNYGRGGGQGDFTRCEAADGSGTNNANFSTPATDGQPPRMQMYLWPGNQLGSQNQVQVTGLGDFNANWARFGPPAPFAGLNNHQLVYAGTGCTALTYPASLPAGNWIAVVDGGTAACQYLVRTTVAQGLGAKGVIVAHNAGGNAPTMAGAFTAAPVTIPTVSVTQADGVLIKAAIAAGTTMGGLRKHPSHPGIRDGDFDNGIIFHEYGHGVSNRLTGPIADNDNCLDGNEQAGEGWSDYLAIVLGMDVTIDTPEGTRGLVPYVLFQPDRTGNGLRPRPYSRTMETQPFTYDSIKSNGWLNGSSLALPHGLGHGWAAVLWDMTWNLVEKHGFAPNIYQPWNSGGNTRSLQYVMDGLKLQGCAPGLVVASRAIIASANILTGGTPGVDAEGRTLFVNGVDTCMVWDSFARRGLGYSAVQGTTNRNDNTQAFDTHPGCRRDFLNPVHVPYGTLQDVTAGDVKPLRFTADGYGNLDVLFSNSPYSRQVTCDTLETRIPGAQFVTPGSLPLNTVSPGNSGLSVSKTGQFTYPWLTDLAWAGTCREVVLTRDDGRQHRAFFRFLAPVEE